MNSYENKALEEMLQWKRKMQEEPSSMGIVSKAVQNKISSLMPERAQKAITDVIKNMVKLVITGSVLTTSIEKGSGSLEQRENIVRKNIKAFKSTAVISGAGTGAGGFVIGMADFPILLSLKLKFLFQAANAYGFNIHSYKERLYILHIFELAFSSDKKRLEVFDKIANWDSYAKTLPENMEAFDWRSFQQEYRDYIDLAKMLQLVPIIGAPVGAIANYRLMEKLGYTAMNAYRMRIFKPL